jgi:hypothetical protein
MKTIEAVCDYCQSKFFRPLKEHKRSISLGRREFCSRNCAGKQMIVNFGEKSNKNAEHLKNYTRADEFTGFRKFIRSINLRSLQQNKEKGATLQDLKDIWDQQKGICPITGWELVLKQQNLPNQASIDRIDNSKGYVKENIRFVALIANYCRNNFTDQQVLDFCSAVVHNRQISTKDDNDYA